MTHREPLEVPGTVFIGDLLQGARDLIENPDDNPEYTRGILELLHDATGEEIGALRDIIFPQPTPLVRYAIELIGGVPEDTSDWQQVAQELYDELHPTTAVADADTGDWQLVAQELYEELHPTTPDEPA